MTEKITFNSAEKGKSGVPISSNVYSIEYLSELSGTEAQTVYNRMRRSDPQVRKVLAAVINPIKAATWSIEPVSQEPKDLQAAALIDKILFKDINFNQKLGEILTFLPHGFAVFEVIHENKQSKEVGAYTGLANLAFRYQSSITEWKLDPKTSKLAEIHQKQSGDLDVDVWLKAETLLMFFNEREGDDNGFPLLRPLYGPYKRKLLIETLKMIGIERFAIPTPKLKVPSDITPEMQAYKDAVAMLSAFTSAESAYITYPAGWELDLQPNSGFDPMKLEDTIKREDEKMAGAILATFLELGTGGNSGAFALGQNLERFFTQVIEAFAKTVQDTINNELIKSLMFLNYGDTIELAPKLVFSGITDKAGEEFMRIVTGYTNAGVVGKDPQLEDHIRKVHKLPKKTEGTELENQGEGQASGDEAPVEGEEVEPVVEEQEETPPAQLKENDKTLMLADAKTPNGLIVQESSNISDIMKSNLKLVGDKLVADIIRKYKQLGETQKLRAVENIKLGGLATYKRQLKGVLTSTCNKSLDQVRAEVPAKQNTKLKNNPEFFSLLDTFETFKFVDSEFSNLPAHVRKLITLQANRVVDRQAQELEDRVAFTFMQNQQNTDSADSLSQDLSLAANNYINSPTVETAAANLSSTLINQTRNEFFFDPEVIEEIYGFKFNNFDPVTPICTKLAGSVFSPDDTEFLSYSPPLHHNCKSFLSVVLKSSKTLPDLQPLPPLTASDRKSITLSHKEKIAKLLEVFETNCKGH